MFRKTVADGKVLEIKGSFPCGLALGARKAGHGGSSNRKEGWWDPHWYSLPSMRWADGSEKNLSSQTGWQEEEGSTWLPACGRPLEWQTQGQWQEGSVNESLRSVLCLTLWQESWEGWWGGAVGQDLKPGWQPRDSTVVASLRHRSTQVYQNSYGKTGVLPLGEELWFQDSDPQGGQE